MTPHELTRRQVVSEMSAIHQEYGFVPDALLAELAADVGRSPRTVRRWASTGQRQRPTAFELDDQGAVTFFACNGNVSATHRQLRADGQPVKSLTTLRRAVARADSAVTAYARGGGHGLHDKTLGMIRPDEHRNSIWALDCQECPVWVWPLPATNPVKPWTVTVLDEATRYVLSVVVVFERPTSEHVIVAINDAARRKPTTVDGVWVGGLPKAVRFDNGAEFKAALVKGSLRDAGIAPLPTMPYRSWLNGKVERWHRTFQDELCAHLPGFTDGPKTLRKRDVFGLGNEILSEDLFLQLVLNWVEDYNTERDHSSLGGRTPLAAWCDDATPLQPADPEWLRLSLLLKVSRKVSKNGVRLHKVDYTAPELAGLVGQAVQVRHLPHDRSFVEVFYNGQWHCTAFPHADLTEAQRERLSALARAQYRSAKGLAAAAANRRIARAHNPSQGRPALRPVPSVVPAEELGADDDALLSLGDTEQDPDAAAELWQLATAHHHGGQDTAATTSTRPPGRRPAPPLVAPDPSLPQDWELLEEDTDDL